MYFIPLNTMYAIALNNTTLKTPIELMEYNNNFIIENYINYSINYTHYKL